MTASLVDQSFMQSIFSIINQEAESDAFLSKATIDVLNQITLQSPYIIPQLENQYGLISKVVASLWKFKMLP